MTRPRLLVLDTSYSLEAIRANRTEASVTCRDLGGFFDRVWTVHPFATLVTSAGWAPRCGRPVATTLNERHVFVEGKVGRYDALAWLPPVNFLAAQIGSIRFLCRLVRTEGISVVRAGDPLLMGVYGWLIARLCGIPLVVRINANNERIRRETGRPMMPRFMRSAAIERRVERWVLTRADLVAAGNGDTRDYAIAMGARPGRTTVFRVGNLVDRVHFVEPPARSGGDAIRNELGLAGRRVLLCIGRLEPVKMPDHALQVLARVRAAGHDAALLLVGGGSMRHRLEAMAESLGVAPHVVFAGPRDQEWISRVIPLADVVLSPLTGRALCEVALGAAPTVAYDVDWHGELIQSGLSGRLVPNGDVRAMAEAAASLLADRAGARRLGARLREAALDMMNPEHLDAHERAQYARLLERQAAPPLVNETAVRQRR